MGTCIFSTVLKAAISTLIRLAAHHCIQQPEIMTPTLQSLMRQQAALHGQKPLVALVDQAIWNHTILKPITHTCMLPVVFPILQTLIPTEDQTT